MSIDDQNDTVGDNISLQVIASDINVNDTLTYTISGQPSGLSISSSSGIISGVISNDADTGSPYQVTVSVTDDGNPQGSTSDSFTWVIDAAPNVNSPPVIANINEQTNTVEDTISSQVAASDSDLGDILTYSAVGLPSGLAISPATGLISGTLSADTDTNSPYQVTVTVTNDGEPVVSANTLFN